MDLQQLTTSQLGAQAWGIRQEGKKHTYVSAGSIQLASRQFKFRNGRSEKRFPCFWNIDPLGGELLG